MATLGNSIDFGDSTNSSGLRSNGIISDCKRAISAGEASGDYTRIEFVEIATTGNATDFGDLSVGRYTAAGMSNGHGGL